MTLGTYYKNDVQCYLYMTVQRHEVMFTMRVFSTTTNIIYIHLDIVI